MVKIQIKLILTLVSFGVLGLLANRAEAYGTGFSTYPLEAEAKLISAEFTGITSQGGGLGMQARFTNKLNEKSVIDAGLGISGGEHSARLFAGYDYELFPDYENQPRTSLKAFIENSKQFGSSRNILGIAPSVSKGFVFWEKEAFPYLSLPCAVSLNGSDNSYQTAISANIGISGLLPIGLGVAEDKQLTANAEVVIGLKNNYSGLSFGVAYPIE